MEDEDKISKKPAATKTRAEMENLSFDIPTSTAHFSRDLLQRFTGDAIGGGTSTAPPARVEEEEEEQGQDIELSLGLSLGGKFGVEKNQTNNLTRSSSLASSFPAERDDNDGAALPPPHAEEAAAYSAGGSLIRTSSLPLESEEEWRKRKELQCLRRMEAKRRRSEKQRNITRSDSSFSRAKSLSAEEKRAIELNLRERLAREKAALGITNRSTSSSQFASSSNHGNVRGVEESSSSTDLEAKAPPQGTCGGGLSVVDMPSVFTKGDGPRGKRVDGILYKYGKGEQVKIMCVCHGTFHSPPEFVRHAGGTDVDHPLKHIVLNPNSSAML